VFIYDNEVAFFQNLFNVNWLPLCLFFKGNNVTFFQDPFNVNKLPIRINGVNEKQILIVTGCTKVIKNL